MIERAPFSGLSVTDAYAIPALHTDVFCLEWSCAELEMNWHGLEDTMEHCFIRDANDSHKIIAYLRVIDTLDGFSSSCPRIIGRVVVDATARGTGLSSQLLRQVIADRPSTGLVLHIQTQAKSIYAKADFHEVGETFMETDTEHVTMVHGAA